MFCYDNGVSMGWNPSGHSDTVVLKDPQTGLTNVKADFKDGALSCSFHRRKITGIDIPNTGDLQTFDLRLLKEIKWPQRF